MVVVTGNLGILSQSRLERISQDASTNTGDANIKLNDVLERVKQLERKEGTLPRSITRKRQRELDRGIAGGRNVEGAQKLFGEKLLPESAGAPIKRNQVFKDLQKKVDGIENTQNAMTKIFGLMSPLVRGSSGLQSIGGLGNMLLNQAAKIGLPVSFITLIATKVWKQYKTQYGKGGTRDFRKLILDEDISRIGIENENELESGANLFLSNPQVLTGLPRGPSNTENLREGMARWKQRKAGTYQ